MIKWQKKGLIYSPDGSSSWAKHTVITPTPFLIADDIIRIYAGFRDNEGVSRIGYIDVASDNPSEIIKVSQEPILDIGQKGCFDDNGMILGDLIKDGSNIYMYYVGFQLVKKVKFLAYSGLAISTDNGETFSRYQPTPIMDRTANALYIRAIHTVLKEGDVWKFWYSVGSDWKVIDNIPYPCYDIRYTESKDGINFEDNVGRDCIGVKDNEYRIGRPRVRKTDFGYEMRYTFDTLDKHYTAGYAVSENGVDWTRLDNEAGIQKSQTGWDSQMLCYPVVIESGDKTYMFYSGNGMGMTGVGYAEMQS